MSRWLKRVGQFLISLTLFCVFYIPSQQPGLIALTQQVWSKRLGREIPEQEAMEIIRDFRNFIALLKEVKRNGKP